MRRAIIYLNDKLHRAIKIKAKRLRQPISEIVSEALKLSLKEDSFDLATIYSRASQSSRSLKAVLRDLKNDRH